MKDIKNVVTGSPHGSAKQVLNVTNKSRDRNSQPLVNDEDKSQQEEDKESEEILQNEDNEPEVLSPKTFDSHPIDKSPKRQKSSKGSRH